MTTSEQIARYKLQLEGLKSWPEGPERKLMAIWVNRQITRLARDLPS
jgi:hypothetical protein